VEQSGFELLAPFFALPSENCPRVWRDIWQWNKSSNAGEIFGARRKAAVPEKY